jgi:hypothetical protein
MSADMQLCESVCAAAVMLVSDLVRPLGTPYASLELDDCLLPGTAAVGAD